MRLSEITAGFRLRVADSLGRGPVVTGRPHIVNDGRLRIGDDFRLSSRPAPSHLVVADGGHIDIGDRVYISFGAAISAQREVRIGNDVRLGPFVVIMDSDFHVAGDRNAIAAPAPVEIGDGVVCGSRVTILRGSRIGPGARVLSGSVVSGEVPAGAVVGGVPARSVGESSHGDGFVGGRSSADRVDVPALVMRVLGLDEAPALAHGPAEIPQWDSLGSLKLLLALEEAFGVTLREEDMATARSVARLSEIVEAERSRAAVAT